MSAVLTLSHAADVHADAVGWGLQQRGHDVVLWSFAEFPSAQLATLHLTPEGGAAVVFPEAGQQRAPHALTPDGADVDVVWRRRPMRPVASEELPESDRTVAVRESQIFCDAGVALAAPSARWVNPEAAARAASLKPVQLRAAREAGLQIPDTLCSNDPDVVRRFAKRHGGRVICKPFRPAAWSGGGKHYLAETALLSEAMLSNDFAIAAAPGIYQPYIDKRYELRITMMGAVAVAAKITVAGPSGLPVDARKAHHVASVVEVELPEAIRQACLRLMQDLGLVFGCLDLVATEDDEILFLEVNEMGQFLWVEDRNPEIPMLSLFTDFIASGRPDFERTTRRDGVTAAAYRRSERYRRTRALRQSLGQPALSNLLEWGRPEPE